MKKNAGFGGSNDSNDLGVFGDSRPENPTFVGIDADNITDAINDYEAVAIDPPLFHAANLWQWSISNSRVIGAVALSISLLILASAVLDGINKIPFAAKLFESIGIFYAVKFAILLFDEDERQEIIDRVAEYFQN